MIDSTNGDTSPPRLYKGDRILLRQVTAVLGEEVSGLPRSSALPPPRRREKLYWRAYLAYLTDPLQRSVDWAWLEFMDGTMSPVAFRRRAAAVGWRTMRDELEAMVAEGVLRHVARQGGFDPPLLDHRLQGRQEGQEPPEPGLPMPDICGKTRALWRRVVGEMGPRFAPVPRTNSRTRRAMKRWQVADFVEGTTVIVGWLTPLGVSLRDRWHRADCWREWERRKAKGLTRGCGGRNRYVMPTST